MKRIAADWLFPDGKVSIPIPGLMTDRTARPPEEIVNDWRRRAKLAKAIIGWTDEVIAAVFGMTYYAVRDWWRISYPPRQVVAALEALTGDHILTHQINLALLQAGKQAGRPKKRKLVPGWERENMPGKTRKDEAGGELIGDVIGVTGRRRKRKTAG